MTANACLSILAVMACASLVSSNDFVTDPATPNLQHGVHCTYSDTTPKLYTVRLSVFEADFGYRDDDGNIIHFTCGMIHRSMLSMAVAPTNPATCGNGDAFFDTVLGVGAATVAPIAIDQSQIRTHIQTIGPFQPGPGDLRCGMTYTAGPPAVMSFAARCYTEANFDKDSSRVFLWDLEDDDCIPETLDVGVTPDNPSETVISQDYLVSLNLFTSATRDLTSLNANFEQSVSPVTAAIALGTTVYLEACIAITDPKLQYFVNGVSVLGLYLYDCEASTVSPASNYFGGSVPSPVGITTTAGCGTNVSPVKLPTDYQFRFAQGDVVGNLPWFNSPNCFRTDAFEAISFARKDISANSDMRIECKVGYCTSLSDTRCFGDISGGNSPGDDYSAFCSTGRRRKREASDVPKDLPRNVSFNYTVVVEFETDSDAQVEDSGCFQKNSFIALTAVLAVILVLMLFLDGFLAVRLMTKGEKSERSGSSSGFSTGSGTSHTGFTNKGYN